MPRMRQTAAALLHSVFVGIVVGETCLDGDLFWEQGGRLECSTSASEGHRRATTPEIEIAGYTQSWEMLPTGEIQATMILGYEVLSGQVTGGFKSIHDRADRITVHSLEVLGGSRGKDLSFESYIDDGNYRMVKFQFPTSRSSSDGVLRVYISYVMSGAVCRNENHNREEFHARWANIWRVPVDGIRYIFTLPPGEWSSDSPSILEPSVLLSGPERGTGPLQVYEAPPRFLRSPWDHVYREVGTSGPSIAYNFEPEELEIGLNPKDVAFGWARVGGLDKSLPECQAEEGSNRMLLLLFLLLLLPIGCIAFFLVKSRPSPAAGSLRGPMVAQMVQAQALPVGQPLPGQPMASAPVPTYDLESASPSAPDIPLSTLATLQLPNLPIPQAWRDGRCSAERSREDDGPCGNELLPMVNVDPNNFGGSGSEIAAKS